MAVVVALVALPSLAHARRRLVVLEFTGPKAERFQADIEKLLRKRNSVVPLRKWYATADQVGATRLSQANVKKVARKLSVDGVLSGKVEKRGSRYLVHLQLREGRTGKLVASPDLVERKPQLGRDGRDVIDSELMPIIDRLPPATGGRDDDDDEADDDDRGGRARGKGRDRVAGRDRGKARGKDKGKGKGKSARDDDDDRRGWRGGDDDDDDEVDDDDRGGRARGKRGGKTADRGKGKSRGKGKDRGRADRRGDRDDDDDDLDDDRGRGRDKTANRDRRRGRSDRDDDDDDARIAFRDGDDDRGDDDRDDHRDDRDRDRDDRDRDAGVDVRAGGRANPVDPRTRPVDLAVGMSFTGRRLSFTTNLQTNRPQGYRGSPVPGIYLAADLFPLAFDRSRRSFTRDLGVTLMFDRVIKISSTLTTMGMTYDLPTTEQHLAAGLLYRHRFGASLQLEGSVRYNQREFVIDKSDPALAPGAVDVPDTRYTYVDPGVGASYLLGSRMAVGGTARFLFVTDTGEMQQPSQYGAATVTGVDVEATFDYRVTRTVLVRAALRAASIGFQFKGNGELTNNRDGDPTDIDVAGARDTYYGGLITGVYAY